MPTVHHPVLLEPQVFVEVEQQIIARHDAPGEKVPGHPVARALGDEVVGILPVGEDVDEQTSIGPKPPGDIGQELPVILHVLEHLHRDDSVKLPIATGGLEAVHVTGDDLQVSEASSEGFPFDVFPLRAGVGHAGDPGVGVPSGHPERERSPSATQLQDVLPIGQARALASEGEHDVLGLGQAFLEGIIVAARIFKAWTEAQLVEARGNLVMLLVGRRGLNGDRQLRQLSDQPHPVCPLCLDIPVGLLFGQSLPQQSADTESDHRIGEHIGLQQTVQKIGSRILRRR